MRSISSSAIAVLVLFFIPPFSAAGQAPAASIARAEFEYLDSLYSFAYLRHRIHKSLERFEVPPAVTKNFARINAVAEELAARSGAHQLGSYQYLVKWVANPQQQEEELSGHPRLAADSLTSSTACCPPDTTGFAAFQQRITDWRVKIFESEQSGDPLSVLRYSDSVIQQTSFRSNDLILAKKLAIKLTDTASYLRLFMTEQYVPYSEQAARDLRWPVSNTIQDKGFVLAALSGLDLEQPPQKAVPIALQLLINRFELLHDQSSKNIMQAYNGPALLFQNKDGLRKLYTFMVEESYTKVPAIICAHSSRGEVIPPGITSPLGYFALHLIQLNSFGIHYPISLFENYLSFLKCLAYSRNYDMEAYADYYDDYLSSVRHKDPMFGTVSRAKGGVLYRESPEAIANRRALRLLPVSVIKEKQR